MLIMLAGCGGGGGGSDRAVSSSPASPGSTTINANISTESSALSGAASQAAAAGSAPAGTGAAGDTRPAAGSAAERSRAEAEARAREQAAAEARAKAEAEARNRALAEAQAKAKAEAEARARADAAAEAQAKARAEEEARKAAEVQAQQQANAATIARLEAERQALSAALAAERARAEAEAKRLADLAAEANARAEQERKAREEAAARVKAEEEAKAKAEADARKAREDKEQANAAAQAAADKENKARTEAAEAAKAREEAERNAIRNTEVEGQLNSRPRTADKPIDSAGISGDVLAAMLDQVVAGGFAGAPSAITQAQPQAQTPDVVVNALQAPDRDYVNAAPPARGTYTEATSAYMYRTSIMSGGGTATFTTVHLGLQVSPSEDALSLPATVNVATGTEQFGEGMTLTGGSITLPRGERQDFGKVVRQWKNDESSVQLMLRAGKAANDAQMCWNYTLPAVGIERLQCNHWEVPDNWKRGNALRFQGVTITEKKDGIEHVWQSKP